MRTLLSFSPLCGTQNCPRRSSKLIRAQVWHNSPSADNRGSERIIPFAWQRARRPVFSHFSFFFLFVCAYQEPWGRCARYNSPLSEVNEPLPTHTKANHSSSIMHSSARTRKKIPHHWYSPPAGGFSCPRLSHNNSRPRRGGVGGVGGGVRPLCNSRHLQACFCVACSLAYMLTRGETIKPLPFHQVGSPCLRCYLSEVIISPTVLLWYSIGGSA